MVQILDVVLCRSWCARAFENSLWGNLYDPCWSLVPCFAKVLINYHQDDSYNLLGLLDLYRLLIELNVAEYPVVGL